MRHALFITFLFLGMLSCTPEVNFTEPQPADVEAVDKFKRKYIGEYLSVSDSSILKITKNSITQYWHFVVEVDSVRNAEELKKGIDVQMDRDKLIVELTEDSVYYTVDYHKDIFRFDPDQVAKYANKSYFLNYKVMKGSWEVSVLQFDEAGYLTITKLDMDQKDVDKLKEITEVEEENDADGDVLEYQIKPTHKELDEILESNLFVKGKKFVRIKK